VVAHAFNSSTQDAEADGSEFEASLVYRVSSRSARATQKPRVKKTNKQAKKQKEKKIELNIVSEGHTDMRPGHFEDACGKL